MAAITISRQMGSLGSSIGKIIAGRLGFRLVWRELINQAALRAGTPEVALAQIDDLGLLGFSPSSKEIRAYRDALRQVILEIADEGNAVIVGRAGQVLLDGREDVLHVRVIAPVSVRVERVAERQGISQEAARAQIEASDSSRARYLKRFYHVRWDDPALYDLVINTARTGPEEAADIIQRAFDLRTQAAVSGAQLRACPDARKG